MDKAQEHALDRELKRRGIDKQQFLREQMGRKQAEQIQKRMLNHRCVVIPTDPVTGAERQSSRGEAPHETHFGDTRMWIEWPYRCVIFEQHAGGKHATLSPELTIWASCSI